MNNRRFARITAALGAVAVVAWGSHAYAVEGVDPHEPAVTSGLALGALPPPGFYFANNLNYVDGSLQDGNGNTTKTITFNTTAWVEIPTLLWATPFHILGAQYGVSFTQTVVTASTTANGVTKNKTGLDNPLIVPLILAWHLSAVNPGLFASFQIPIGLKAGDTGDRNNGTNEELHNAANTYLFAPNVAVAWFNGHGLEVTLNGEYDIQTENDNFDHFIPATQAPPGVRVPAKVKYQSGDVITLDFGVNQVLPGAYKKWQIGFVGSYATQVNSDRETISNSALPQFFPNGTKNVPGLAGFASEGNKFETFRLGPSVGYNFGPVFLGAYYTRDLFTRNGVKADTIWTRIGIPL